MSWSTFTRQDFIGYLRDTLIPDLKDSGYKCTAQDFEAAALLIEDPRLEGVAVDDSGDGVKSITGDDVGVLRSLEEV